MLRKKTLLIVTLIIMLLALPVTALAASKSNGNYTLWYPDSGGECDPDEIIYTTGVPDDGYVAYRFKYQLPDLSWVYDPMYAWYNWDGSSLGNLSVVWPYDTATAIQYGIVVLAYDGSGASLGKIDIQWSCEPPEPPTDGEWCSPGYFRNHFESWVGYDPGADFDTTFGVNFFTLDKTLGETIWLGGGGNNALARLGTAALLSAAHPDVDYAYSVGEVIGIVQAGDQDALEDAAIEDSCPLD